MRRGAPGKWRRYSRTGLITNRGGNANGDRRPHANGDHHRDASVAHRANQARQMV
jgi:hypothetical protein